MRSRGTDRQQIRGINNAISRRANLKKINVNIQNKLCLRNKIDFNGKLMELVFLIHVNTLKIPLRKIFDRVGVREKHIF